MKKILLLLVLSIVFINPYSALAAEPNAYDWEISMQPKPTAEQIEATRWNFILENDFGVYAYDADSLKANTKKQLVEVTVKTVFTNTDVMKNLNKTYADKLENKDKVAYCEMKMLFSLSDKTYAVKQLDVYSKNKVKLEERKNKVQMVAVPEKTFAEAMLEIATAFYTEQENKSVE